MNQYKTGRRILRRPVLLCALAVQATFYSSHIACTSHFHLPAFEGCEVPDFYAVRALHQDPRRLAHACPRPFIDRTLGDASNHAFHALGAQFEGLDQQHDNLLFSADIRL